MPGHKPKHLTRKMRKRMKDQGVYSDEQLQHMLTRAESQLPANLSTAGAENSPLTKSPISREIYEKNMKDSLNFNDESGRLRGDLFRAIGIMVVFLALLIVGSIADQKTGFLTNVSRELVTFLNLSL